MYKYSEIMPLVSIHALVLKSTSQYLTYFHETKLEVSDATTKFLLLNASSVHL